MNADDFGLTDDVTRGILAAHKNGQVSSTTLMVNMPGTDAAVASVKDCPDLGVGLHFNLTEGRPLTIAPSLVDETGQFFLRSELLRRCFRGAINPDDVTREFEAQFARMHNLSIVPTHVDSHQHVHMAPLIYRAISPVLKRQVDRLRLARPPRPAKGIATDHRAIFRYTSMSVSASRIRRSFTGCTNDRLVSLHLLPQTEEWTPERYDQVIDRAGPEELVEVMVHPFEPGPELELMYRDDPIREIRMAFAEDCWKEHGLLTSTSQRPFDSDRYRLVSWAGIQ